MTNMKPRPVAFRDLPAEDYPFTLEFFKTSTRELVHTIEVSGPGAIEIPALGKELGESVGVRVVQNGVVQHEEVPDV